MEKLNTLLLLAVITLMACLFVSMNSLQARVDTVEKSQKIIDRSKLVHTCNLRDSRNRRLCGYVELSGQTTKAKDL